MKITIGIVCFNSMPFIEGALTMMYPWASQILVAEGPVQYWQDQGYRESTDGTIKVIKKFPDPEKKIELIQGQWEEKDEQANAYIPLIKDDTDFLWQVDPDEFYRDGDIKRILKLLPDYDVIGFQWFDFVGSFDKYKTTHLVHNRIWKWKPGSRWRTTRPAMLEWPDGQLVYDTGKILAGHILSEQNIYMYHYSHVFQHQVEARDEYYSARKLFYRWDAELQDFKGTHPKWIKENKERLGRENAWASTNSI